MEPNLTYYKDSRYKPHSSRKPHKMEILLPFDAVKGNLNAVMDGWHKLAAEISPARSLFFTAQYGQVRYMESIFLSMAQAAEVFHRRHYGGTYLPESDYQSNVYPILAAAIPSTLPSDIRDAFRRKLEFFHEYSLGKRLKLMVRRHKAVFDNYVPAWKSKLQGIVDARNYFTHYSATAPSKPAFKDLRIMWT